MASLVPPSIKVLIVEDEPGLRQMLEILFRREGYTVVAAPGYAMCYLWALAGESTTLTPSYDPVHAWLA